MSVLKLKIVTMISIKYLNQAGLGAFLLWHKNCINYYTTMHRNEGGKINEYTKLRESAVKK